MFVFKVIVTIADLADCEYVKTKSNIFIKTDAKLGEVKDITYDAVVIPGGPSYKTLAAVSYYLTMVICIMHYNFFLF